MNTLPKMKKESGLPLVSLLTDHLREYIRKSCSPGEKFFSERGLCDELGLSRVTVGKAISSLVQEGFLYQEHGSGTYVAEYKHPTDSTIALMVYHSDNPFYSKVVRSIQEEADKKGFQTILFNSNGLAESENSALKKVEGRISGLILAPFIDAEGKYSAGLDRLIKQDFPVVVICHGGKTSAAANSVIPDFRAGGFAATEHLIERGYTKILFFAIRQIFDRKDIRDRFDGYISALDKHGIRFEKDWLIMVDGSDEFNGFFNDGYNAAANIVPAGKERTAIFSLGDSSAIGLLKGLREKGLRVPEDIGLCGFDDIELASQWGIELTTVRVSVSDIGRSATQLLASCINDKKNHKPENIISPVELIVRKTT